MSLAYSLVNSLAASQPNEDDKTLVIDHYSRRIIIPSGIKSLGVENDDDVLRLNFRMPRYLGTVDLHKFNIYINYINAQGKDDIYSVDDATVVGDDVMFSWLVGPIATAYIGTTAFNVRMTITDSDSVVKQEYNTAVAKLQVLEGLKCSKRAVSKYSDILAQWERKLFGISGTEEAKIVAASETQQTAITNKGAEVLATIPAEYQATSDLANEGARTKADAIICSAQGEIITVSDSSDDYLRGLKVFGKTTQVTTTGKNLLPPFTMGIAISTTNGSEYESSRNAVTDYIPVDFNANSRYCLSGLLNTLYSFVAAYNANHEFLGRSSASAYDNLVLMPTYFSGGTAVGTGDIAYLRVSIYENSPTVSGSINDIINMHAQLEVGNVATEYEPYSGGVASPSPEWPQPLNSVENPTVDIFGKNLLNSDLLVGGNFVKNNDGTYTFTKVENSGTSATCPLNLPAGDYVMSWGEVKRTCESYRVYINYADGTTQLTGLTNLGTNRLQISTDAGIQDIRLSLASNVTTDSYVIFDWLQIEAGTEATDYEPYKDRKSLAIAHTLPGIPVTSGGNYTDSEGQQWICDEVDLERGVYIQRIARLLLNGSENWGLYDYQSTYSGFSLHNALDEIHSRSPGMSNQFHNFKQSVDDGIWVGVGNMSLYAISKEWYAKGLDAWKAHLSESPLEVIHPRITPIETPLTADEIAAFKALKSHYPNTTVLNDSGAGMLVRYNADTETWIKNLIDEKIAAAVAKL